MILKFDHLRHIRHFTNADILLLHCNTFPCKNRDDVCFTLNWGHLYYYICLGDLMVKMCCSVRTFVTPHEKVMQENWLYCWMVKTESHPMAAEFCELIILYHCNLG